MPNPRCRRCLQVRKNGTCAWLRPDGKTQVGAAWGMARLSGDPGPSPPACLEKTPNRVGNSGMLGPPPTASYAAANLGLPTRPAQHPKTHSAPCLFWPPLPPQVTVEYKKEGGAVVPLRVHTILISTQHNPDVSNDKIKEDLMEHVIKPVVRGAGGPAWPAACPCLPARPGSSGEAGAR